MGREKKKLEMTYIFCEYLIFIKLQVLIKNSQKDKKTLFLPFDIANKTAAWLSASSWSQIPGFESQLYHCLNVCPWANSLTSSCLSFLFCKMHIITAPPPQSVRNA